MKFITSLIKWLVGIVVTVGGVAFAAPFFLLSPQAVPTDPPAVSQEYDAAYRDAIIAAEEYVREIQSTLGAPSVSAAVGVSGQLIWAETIGFELIEEMTPATLETRYPIASVSKSLTATAAMMLAEQGIVDLDATVGDVLPNYPAHARDITLRQLLGHRGGIRHYGMMSTPPFSEALLNVHFESVREGLTIFQDDALLFEPGTSFSYSTFGYSLASAMLEAMTGQDYGTLMSDTLFAPSGLSSMVLDDRNATIPNRAMDYSTLFDAPVYADFSSIYVAPGEVIRSDIADASYKWAAGGIVATPRDLVVFGNGLLGGNLVTNAGRAALFTPPVAEGEEGWFYGLGFNVLQRSSRHRADGSPYNIRYHGGAAIGSQCVFILYTEEQLTLAVCMNAYTGGSGDMLQSAVFMGDGFLDVIEGRE